MFARLAFHHAVRLRRNADALDLPVQLDAGGFLHAGADRFAEFLDLRGGGAALVDEEIAVELGDLAPGPMAKPRMPALSMSCQDLWPGGFLKVEPPVRVLIGWVDSRALGDLVHGGGDLRADRRRGPAAAPP